MELKLIGFSKVSKTLKVKWIFSGVKDLVWLHVLEVWRALHILTEGRAAAHSSEHPRHYSVEIFVVGGNFDQMKHVFNIIDCHPSWYLIGMIILLRTFQEFILILFSIPKYVAICYSYGSLLLLEIFSARWKFGRMCIPDCGYGSV